jgi:quercetin dioxygenase-like cupin family protein
MADSERAARRRLGRPSRLSGVLIIGVLLAVAASAYAATAGFELRARAPITRDVLAQASNPAGAPGRTLALSRVTIAPGQALDLHHHPGTQISEVTRGTLTYWVKKGSVTVRRGERVVRKIRAGQHGQIPAGDWIAESPGTIHRGANLGTKPVVILIASLFKTGAPASIPAGQRTVGDASRLRSAPAGSRR